MASIRGQVCFLVPHHFISPSTQHGAQHPLCPAPLSNIGMSSFPLRCSATSLAWQLCLLKSHPHSTATFSLASAFLYPHICPPAHLHPSPATLTHYTSTLQGSASEFCLLNTIIFSDPGSLWLPLLATELAWIKLGLHLFSGCFTYVSLVSLFFSVV